MGDEERKSPDRDRGKERSGGGQSSRRRLTAPPARVEDRRQRGDKKGGGGDRRSERRGDSSRSRERGSTSAHQSERDREGLRDDTQIDNGGIIASGRKKRKRHDA
jgi:hypothetical protein